MSADGKELLLKYLAIKFYKGDHRFSLNSEDVEKMDWDWQERFLNITFNSNLMKMYPVSCQYSKLFLKNLISHVEPSHEVHDDVYAQLCRVMKASHQEDFSYRHYIIGQQLSEIVIMKETRNMVVNGTTGLKTWEAALILADWILCNKDEFANKNVLELGSGIGFTGITIGKMCNIKSLLLSDCHEEVLATIRENIQINFSHFKPKIVKNFTMYSNETKLIGAIMLDWNDIEKWNNEMLDPIPDIIIGADIVYDPAILRILCKVLQTFSSKNNNLEIYIASIIRNKETFNEFLKTLEAMNYSWEEIDFMKNVYLEWDEHVPKCLLKIKLKA